MASPTPPKIQIPAEVMKFLEPTAPREVKMLAAQGLVPMAPAVLITALFMLTNDGDGEVAQTAKRTLQSQPESIMRNVLNQPLHPKILDFEAQQFIDRPELLEIILLNRHTADETLAMLSPQLNERLLVIVSENQERLLRAPNIAEALRKNPNAPQSIIDRMVSFLRMNGVVLEGISPELTSDEVKQLMQEDDKKILESIFVSGEANIDDLSTALFDDSKDDLVEYTDEDKKPTKEEEQSFRKSLATLTVAAKIKLALKGNKEVRNALIKDPNKLVCTSVVKSPKIQDSEVASIASMRSVNDEVLRIIARNPDWMKNYSIKHALVFNPKCPLPIAVQFMKHLRANDLGMLSKNKNVSQQLQRLAKQLTESKS